MGVGVVGGWGMGVGEGLSGAEDRLCQSSGRNGPQDGLAQLSPVKGPVQALSLGGWGPVPLALGKCHHALVVHFP